MPLAGRPGCATLLEEKKRDPPLNRGIRSCEGFLLKHNVRNENNERYKHNAFVMLAASCFMEACVGLLFLCRNNESYKNNVRY